MEKINVFGRKLKQFAILDNAEGNINTIWQDERTGEFFMESMLEKCRGYVYFKASKENMLKFIEQGITLEELYAKGSNDEIFVNVFQNHNIEKPRNTKNLEIKFHCGGKYRMIGMYDEKIKEIKRELMKLR
ncbi:MAG: hypothetical protein ACOX2F_09945 [bacterium]